MCYTRGVRCHLHCTILTFHFQAILVGGLCPSTADPAQCEANLPQFWNMIAALLWPGYWDPTVSWISFLLSKLSCSNKGATFILKMIFKYSNINLILMPTRVNGCVLPSVKHLRTLP